MKRIRCLLIMLPLLFAACATTKTFPPQGITPPRAPQHEHTYSVIGQTISDEYYWMHDPEVKNPETLAYIEAENAYADSILAPLHKETKCLMREMEGRFPTITTTYPFPEEGYQYYERYPKGKDYPLYCRVRDNDQPLDPKHPWKGHKEEVMLDGNIAADGREFFSIGETIASLDGRYLAWTADTTGAENYTLRIRDLSNGKDLPEIIYPASGTTWSPDSKYIFYMRYVDPTKDSPGQIWRHKVNTPASDDVLVYQENAPSMDCFAYLGKNHRFIFVGTGDDDTSEYRLIPANQPEAKPVLFQARQTGVSYMPYCGADRFYILTNRDGASNFKIMTTPLNATSAENWQDFYVPGDSVFITDIDLSHNWLVVHEYRHGLPQLKVIDLRNRSEKTLQMPEPAYTLYVGGNADFEGTTFRYTYSSLACPQTLYDYNLVTGEQKVLDQDKINGFDPRKYATERVMATASDGTKVPVSLLYRRDLFRHDGTNPLYVYAYGSYGIRSDAEFASLNLSLVDRGFVYAIAHIRGGDEMGRQWFEDGRLMNKKHTFQDFIDCTEYLVKNKYGDPKRVVAEGASAGGMLMGVISNWRPDLFTVILAGVPAADEFTHEQDSTLAGVAYHHLQWGDPTDPVQGTYFHSWDPYQNVGNHDYPTMFVTAGLNDSRVPYWEPAKWVARLRAHHTGDNLILLTTETTGHSGSTGRFGFFSDYAMEYAMIFRMFGLD